MPGSCLFSELGGATVVFTASVFQPWAFSWEVSSERLERSVLRSSGSEACTETLTVPARSTSRTAAESWAVPLRCNKISLLTLGFVISGSVGCTS